MMLMRNHGVTLIELLIGIAMLVTVSTFAIPAFHSLLLNRKVMNMKDSIVSALRFSQSQASKSSYPIALCATADFISCSTNTDDWKKGWVIYERKGAAGAGVASTNDILQVYQVPNVEIADFTFSLQKPAGTAVLGLEFSSGGLPAVGVANSVFSVCNKKSKSLFTIVVSPAGVIGETSSVATAGCPI